jgi:hypothetical protein
MTSEAIEESGENVFMFAIGRGSGTARRFESGPTDANEPSDMGWLKPGRRTAAVRLQNEPCHYSFMERSTQSITGASDVFWPSVCRTHHLTTGGCG